jgi:hypothetical protein
MGERACIGSEPVACGRLHLDNVGTEIRVHLTAPACRDAAADLDDPDIAQDLTHDNSP